MLTVLAGKSTANFDRTALETDPEPFTSALSLYGGPYLDGLVLSEAPEFELWCAAERERLAQLYLRCLAALADIHRVRGQWQDVVATAGRALEYDSLQEPMFQFLMEAIPRLGDRTAAVRQYEMLRSALNRELGVEPLPETEALHASILSATMSIGATSASRPGAGVGIVKLPEPRAQTPFNIPQRPPAIPPPARTLPFVGRTLERAIFNAEMAAATSGARVLLITGEVGIGKSRLWHEWSRDLPPDPHRVVLEARCLEPTQGLPFAPLVQMLRTPSYFRTLSGQTPVPRVWLAEISRLLPEIRLSHPDLTQPMPLPPEDERTRLFEAIVQAILGLEPKGLLFFLDDAHWADQATLDWLGYLVDRLRDWPLLLTLAYRSDEASAALVRLAAGWTRQGIGAPAASAPPDPGRIGGVDLGFRG